MPLIYASDVIANDKVLTDGVCYTVTSASVDKGDIVLIGRPHIHGALANVVLRMREVDTLEYCGHIGQRVEEFAPVSE